MLFLGVGDKGRRFMIFKRNYSIKLLLGVSVVLMTACMRTFTLPNGYTKVPAKPSVYKNKAKFDKSSLALIDTGSIYEEFDQHYNVLRRLDTHIETGTYGAYRFYPDGKFNLFFFDRDKSLQPNDLNPEHTGYRGVYYSEETKVRYDLFAATNGLGWIGKLTGTFKFSGDTLYEIRDVDKKHIDIYIKRKLPPGYLDYKANW
jgi:hypothetical protein